MLLKALCHPRKRRPALPLVMPYDKGLICVNLATEIGYKIIFHGYHDPAMAKVLRHITRPGHTCIDIGANIGSYTILMAFAAGPGGRVFALEPQPEVAADLLKNVALNRLTNVAVLQAALTERDGETPLFTQAQDATNQMISSLRPGVAPNERELTVKTISARTLEQALGDRGCDVIKMDVNGAELLLLREMGGLIARCRPSLIVEFRKPLWERFGTRIEDALELFRSWGYDLYSISKGLTRPLGSGVPDICNLLCVPSLTCAKWDAT